MKPRFEKGTYKGKVVDQGFGKSKDKGTPCFEVSFEVVAKVDPVTKTEAPVENPCTCKATLWLTTGTFEKFAKGQIMSLGWDGTSLLALDPNTSGYQDLTGNEALFYCGHKPDIKNPKESREDWSISDGQPRGGGAKVAKVADVAGDLDSLFNLSPKVSVTPVTQAPIDEDSLPF